MVLLSINSYSQIKYQGDTTYVDTINFETPCSYFSLDTSSMNIWEIGMPSQFFLDSSYSFNKGIMTDTNDYYPINNHSCFDITLINGQEPIPFLHYSVGVMFKHKFETDTLRDGGFITVSYDNGNTWTNIIEDCNEPYCMGPLPWNEIGLYGFTDTLHQGEYGFSGNSNGWITTTFSWAVCLVKSTKEISDTMIIRFNFVSDSINNNREGWLIDDITIFWIDLGTGISQIELDKQIEIFPNPITNSTRIKSTDRIKRVDLYSNTGQLMKSKNCDDYEFDFNRGKIMSGIYYFRFYFEDGIIQTKKVIVND